MKPVKPKKCRVCKGSFTPYNSLQVVCSPKCALEHTEKQREKAWRAKKKKLKEGLLTHSERLKIAQVAFNQYIRERDRGKGCISCGKILQGKFDAGHCFSVGAYPNLRFDEDNVWGQCVECNQHLHGNQAEYLIRLEGRIGLDRLEALKARRRSPSKLSAEEITVLTEKYRKKVKEMRQK